MKATWNWLLDLVELDREVTAEEGARALTRVGLEVEEHRAIGADVSGVVVAEVVATRSHPDASKLTIVDVTDGSGAIPVVCGASNVPKPGGRVLWARPGAVLPGGTRIATKMVKGVESAGMLAAADELGVADKQPGIVVLDGPEAQKALGCDAMVALNLRDDAFDIAAPANRSDVLGHLGIARELAAIFGGRLKPWSDPDSRWSRDKASGAIPTVTIDVEGCDRYVAEVIEGVTVGPSPLWLQARLHAVGVRSISNVVDVTNYIMFECGQPLHGFDADRIRDDKIVVRSAQPAENMVTLDNSERQLQTGDLVIGDGARAAALAGVMGGLDTEVTAATTRVLLESAHFDAKRIRATSRRLGLQSEASLRFEHGIDAEQCAAIGRRGAFLLAQLTGGQRVGCAVDVYPKKACSVSVSMRHARCQQLTGVEIGAEEARATLEGLGFSVTECTDNHFTAQVPSFRRDVTREVDLIEEVLRIRGFDSVPATLPALTRAPAPNGYNKIDLVRRSLVVSGFSEALSFGFTSPDHIVAMGFDDADPRRHPLRLANPLSREQSLLRTSLWPNLLAAAARNQKHGERDYALFEIGSVFLSERADHLPAEPVHVAAVIGGKRRGWLGAGADVDYYDIKGALQTVVSLFSATLVCESKPPKPRYMHPGICARVVVGGRLVGEVGEIHPDVRAAFDIDQPVFGFSLDLEVMPEVPLAQMNAIPRYPAVVRDISMLLEQGVEAGTIAAFVEAERPEILESFQVLEDFRDPNRLPAGKKGLLWSMTYRSAQNTLTDAEVDSVHAGLVNRLLGEFSATRR